MDRNVEAAVPVDVALQAGACCGDGADVGRNYRAREALEQGTITRTSGAVMGAGGAVSLPAHAAGSSRH
jgi:hypothetical protein